MAKTEKEVREWTSQPDRSVAVCSYWIISLVTVTDIFLQRCPSPLAWQMPPPKLSRRPSREACWLVCPPLSVQKP